MEGRFYSVKELAEKLNLCAHTIRRAIKAKRIFACRPGIGKKSAYRIHESEITRIMNVDFETMKEEWRE